LRGGPYSRSDFGSPPEKVVFFGFPGFREIPVFHVFLIKKVDLYPLKCCFRVFRTTLLGAYSRKKSGRIDKTVLARWEKARFLGLGGWLGRSGGSVWVAGWRSGGSSGGPPEGKRAKMSKTAVFSILALNRQVGVLTSFGGLRDKGLGLATTYLTSAG